MSIAVEGRGRTLRSPVALIRSNWLGATWSSFLIILPAGLILYPLVILFVGAFSDSTSQLGQLDLTRISINNFIAVFGNASVWGATLNTFIICTGGSLVALVIGLSFSWIVVRTNTPFSNFVAAIGRMPLFVHALIAGIAWSILGSPRTGLLNTIFDHFGLGITVNLYSYAGIIFVFGVYYSPYVYMFTSSALRNMDPTLEEAAEITGVSTVRTMLTVTFPLILPAILSSVLLSFIIMLGVYGIPAALASPVRISLLPTFLYTLVAWSPPQYNLAAAVAVILMIITGACVVVQQFILMQRSYITVGGKSYRPKRLDLGIWKYFTLGLVFVYLFITVILPFSALGLASFRRHLFLPDMAAILDASLYSPSFFIALFQDPLVIRSIMNAVYIGMITTTVGGLLSLAVGYSVYRTRVPGRRSIEVISMLPIAVPGLVVGVAYLWAWIGAFGGVLWGAVWIMALAYVSRFLPDSLKVLSSSLIQIHPDLEDASKVCGRRTVSTIWHIVVPLTRPGLAAAMSLLFILAIRELGATLFLFTPANTVMSVLLFDYFESGRMGVTAAFGIVQSVILLAAVGVCNLLVRLAR